jgi:uncharacterized protein YbcI
MVPRRDEVEVAARDAVVRFWKRHLGRGPREARVFLAGDRVLICLRGLVGTAERDLAAADGSGVVASLLRELFRRLVEHHRPRLEAVLAASLGSAVSSLHLDLCAARDEGILVVCLDGIPEAPADPAEV